MVIMKYDSEIYKKNVAVYSSLKAILEKVKSKKKKVLKTMIIRMVAVVVVPVIVIVIRIMDTQINKFSFYQRYIR